MPNAPAALVIALEQPLPPGTRWQPKVGEEAIRLMQHKQLPEQAGQDIIETAAGILSRGQPPADLAGQRTGLVVGYVQSGKTLSFTTVVALARDNNVPVVIVVAGTKEPLLVQTIERLTDDLQVTGIAGPPRWLHIRNPDTTHRALVEHALEEWRDPTVSSQEKPTLLLTVLKHNKRLENLNALVELLDLNGVPAVVIDDEADQASLNNRTNQNRQSANYAQLLDLRRQLPSHTFLQYTATPQAPLLINIIDNLSPDFPEVLEPGTSYVGGREMFNANRRYARVIPAADIPAPNNPLVEPPPSLLQALRVFFVGVAAGYPTWGAENPNRSMLVHPSRTTGPHFEYLTCIERVVGEWRRLLALPENNPDRRDLVADFRIAYDDVGQSEPQVPPFDEIMAHLPRAISRTFIREINTRAGRKTPKIEWQQAYGWILVGGQSMDRGFTVKELTVTYMPRGPGMSNADTLQQRARFFGYKRQYLGYCRVYLEAAVLDAFEAYVEHEEEMRSELIAVRNSGRPLREWKRRFVLDGALRPCRNNVIRNSYVRGNYNDDWFFPHLVRMNQGIIDENGRTVDAFNATINFMPDTTFVSRLQAQQHLVCDPVPLRRVLDDLLVPYRVEAAEDTDNMLGLMLQLERALTINPDETARIYQMRPQATTRRGVNQAGRIDSARRLLQGKTEAANAYPGDFFFLDRSRVNIQIHTPDITDGARGPVVRSRVPIVAVWVPSRLETDWLAQGRNRAQG
ncbi:MAG TPA: Z1 domain-containing protein [Hyphomicrobium sp.]|nr:Z1 domain-containing protein [Hyphomicrobium sp.]